LVEILRARGVELGSPHIIARTAWTTDELSDAIDAEKPRGTFQIVTLMVGVNDQYRSRPVSSFATEYRPLLERAKRFAGNRPARTFAISIPDWGATPFARSRDRAVISAEIDVYNTRGKELAEKAGVQWVDVTAISRDMQSDPALVIEDGLHPSGAMYRRWAELIAPLVTSALSL
jgi:lysophospholipase L1-like esterase